MPSIGAVLKAVKPSANPAFVAASEAADVGAIMAHYGINTPTAQAQVIGQTAHECGFAKFEEGLSYSATRLTQVWPSRFPSLAAAQPYAKNPKALAIKVYGGRMGNRPNTEDGWSYRGSGPLQHTGRAEFERVTKRTGMDVVAHPEFLRQVVHAKEMWHGACSYIVDRGALPACLAGETSIATKKINGGQIGLADRQILVGRAAKALSGKTIEAAVGAAPAAKVEITEKTTAEDADDKKKNATRTTVGAPAGGGAAGGGSKQGGGADNSTAIAIGIGVAVLIGVVAIILWRKFFAAKAHVETMELQQIQARLAAA
jgi:putative chitinase